MQTKVFGSVKKYYLNNKLEALFLAFLTLLTLFLKTYNLEAHFPFSWDQARDAEVIWQMLRECKLTLIGPQVVSNNAFFLGPLWYYLLAPFYFISGMDPIGAAYSAVFAGVSTVIAIYFFTKKIAGSSAGAIASILWIGDLSIIAWNPMLVPILTMGILFFCIKIIESKKNYFIPAFLLFGLSLQIHFQMIFLAVPLLFSLTVYLKKNKVPVKQLTLSLLILFLTFIPQILFDIRHEFLNTSGVIKIFIAGSEDPDHKVNYLTQLIEILPKIIDTNFFLPKSPIPKNYVGIIVLVISLFGLIKLKSSRLVKTILFSALILPVFIFSLYRGDLSEYYFYLCQVPLIVGFSNTLKLAFNFSKITKIVIIAFLIYVSFLNISTVINFKEDNGLLFQKQTVQYLKNQQQDKLINVSFDVPYNADAGYRYLFKYYDLKTRDIPEAHLWTILIPIDKEPGKAQAIFGKTAVIRR